METFGLYDLVEVDVDGEMTQGIISEIYRSTGSDVDNYMLTTEDGGNIAWVHASEMTLVSRNNSELLSKWSEE